MMNRKTILDVWDTYVSDGFFSTALSLTDATERFPWIPSPDDAVSLDLMYYLNHSGKKLISGLVSTMVGDDGKLTALGKLAIVKAVSFKYETQWRKLWNTMILTYDPASNYNVTTTRELSKQGSEDESLNTSRTGSDSTVHGLTQTTQHGKINTELESYYGFNSDAETPPPRNKVVSTDSGSTTVSNTGTDTNNRDLSDDSTRIKSAEDAETEETHKTGVIGTVSVQKLISEERDLWIWNFYDQVFKDLDKELALSIYDVCR